MSDARTAILAGIRAALGRGAPDTAQRSALERRLAQCPTSVRVSFTEELRDRFVRKATEKAGTVAAVASMDAIPQAVADYLAANLLPPKISIAPALRELDWPGHWEINHGPGRLEERVAVTPCVAAVAETGSLVLVSGPMTPTTHNFLPEDHLVVLRTDQIVRHLEDIWPLVRALADGWPRTVNIISGPSRTADVGQVIVRPAHGPKRLHVFIVARADRGAASAD